MESIFGKFEQLLRKLRVQALAPAIYPTFLHPATLYKVRVFKNTRFPDFSFTSYFFVISVFFLGGVNFGGLRQAPRPNNYPAANFLLQFCFATKTTNYVHGKTQEAGASS